MGEKEALLRPALLARQTNWLSDRVRSDGHPVRCTAKIRYNSDPQPAEVIASPMAK